MTFGDYISAGWHLCLIAPGSKGPRDRGWNERNAAMPTIPPGYGAGLCHAWSGTCAIDIDNIPVAHAWLAERGVSLDALLLDPMSVQISSGREGRAKLLYALPEPLTSIKTAPFQAVSAKSGKLETYTALDFRCATRDGLTVQDVLPPTIHPETHRPYEWRYDELLADWRTPPRIPPELEAVWRAQLAPATQTATEPVAPKGAAFPELEALLAQEDPDGDYKSWIRVGLALHHETGGSRAGLALWDRWSTRSAKYKGIDDLEPHWRSFSATTANPITLGSLRRDQVATAADFPIVPASTNPEVEDTRPEAVMRRLLEGRLVFVSGQDCYYDLAARGDPWLSDRSVRHIFCPHMPQIMIPGKGGVPDRMSRPDPVEYMKNSETKTVVDAVGIHPGAERLYSEDGKRWVNRYTPRTIEPLRPNKNERDAFDFMWSRMQDEMFRRWLLKFYAHAVQKPGVKITSAPLLFSEATGTGKNTIAKLVPELLFGPQWVRTMSGNVLGSSFNDVLGETWWLYLEELRSGATKSDRVHMTNKMKAWITDDFVEVHPKGLKPYDVRNRTQVTATSNFDDAAQLDNNDRRWAVCEMGAPLTEREGLDLYGFLQSERAPGVLRHIFCAVDLTGFAPKGRAPMTRAKKVMIRAGVGSWESSLVERMMSAAPPFDRDVFYISDVQDLVLGRNGPSAVYLGRVLSKPPFLCAQMPNHTGRRMWAWRNQVEWEKVPDSARREYMQSGQRPRGMWSENVPPLIQELSVDGAVEQFLNHPCNDLL